MSAESPTTDAEEVDATGGDDGVTAEPATEPAASAPPSNADVAPPGGSWVLDGMTAGVAEAEADVAGDLQAGDVAGDLQAGDGADGLPGVAGGSWVLAGANAGEPDSAGVVDDAAATRQPAPDWPAGDVARAGTRDAIEADRATAEIEGQPTATDDASGTDRAAPPGRRTAAATAIGAASLPGGLASRPSKFMAELSRAMQAAAQAERDDGVARLAAEAKQRIEEIQQRGTAGTAELRRQADDDLAGTREWSKAEIARIREETDRRIAERKARLEADVERHTATVRRRVELVREAVANHERQLAAFVEQLLAEEDPARIASLAQLMPEPPALDVVEASVEMADDGGAIAGATRADEPPGAEVDPATVMVEPSAAAADQELPPALEEESTPELSATAVDEAAIPDAADDEAQLSAETAAAAEAEAFASLDASDEAAWLTPRASEDAPTSDAAATARTELVVRGLASVPGIAGFKRELSRIEGVRSVGVSAGQAGEFVFAVAHDAGVDLAQAIPSISAFEARVDGQVEAGLSVSATEPAAVE